MEDRGIRIKLQAGARDFLFSQCPDLLWGTLKLWSKECWAGEGLSFVVKRPKFGTGPFHLHVASRILVEFYLHLSHTSSDAIQLNTETNLSYVTYTVKKWHLNNPGTNKSTYIYVYIYIICIWTIWKRAFNYLLYEVGRVVTEIEVELPGWSQLT